MTLTVNSNIRIRSISDLSSVKVVFRWQIPYNDSIDRESCLGFPKWRGEGYVKDSGRAMKGICWCGNRDGEGENNR